MLMENLKNFDLIVRRYWKAHLDKDSTFSFTQEEKIAFNSDIIHYFQECHHIIRIDLELKSKFTPKDLLTYLQNVEDHMQNERYNRVLVAYGEVFDEEFHLFSDLLLILEVDLAACIEEFKCWIILRIWNSQYNMYDPRTDLLINQYLDDDGEYKDYLVSICYRGINNPSFCRWILQHWSDCSCFQYKLKKILGEVKHLRSEQIELLTKIKALE